MPTPQQVLANEDGTPAIWWWRFWQGLFARSAATIPYLVATGLTALGATQATALALTAEWNEVTTVAAGTGVVLNSFGAGFESMVWNAGANALSVYPPLGCSIDGGAPNAPYALAASKAQVFYQLTATKFRSLQLG